MLKSRNVFPHDAEAFYKEVSMAAAQYYQVTPLQSAMNRRLLSNKHTNHLFNKGDIKETPTIKINFNFNMEVHIPVIPCKQEYRGEFGNYIIIYQKAQAFRKGGIFVGQKDTKEGFYYSANAQVANEARSAHLSEKGKLIIEKKEMRDAAIVDQEMHNHFSIKEWFISLFKRIGNLCGHKKKTYSQNRQKYLNICDPCTTRVTTFQNINVQYVAEDKTAFTDLPENPSYNTQCLNQLNPIKKTENPNAHTSLLWQASPGKIVIR